MPKELFHGWGCGGGVWFSLSDLRSQLSQNPRLEISLPWLRGSNATTHSQILRCDLSASYIITSNKYSAARFELTAQVMMYQAVKTPALFFWGSIQDPASAHRKEIILVSFSLLSWGQMKLETSKKQRDGGRHYQCHIKNVSWPDWRWGCRASHWAGGSLEEPEVFWMLLK